MTFTAIAVCLGVFLHPKKLLAEPIAPECQSGKTVNGVVSENGSRIKFQLAGQPQRYFADMLVPESNDYEGYSLAGKTVTLIIAEGSRPDRYRRLPAQVVIHSKVSGTSNPGVWLQATLLSKGESLLAGNQHLSKCFRVLRKFENSARLARLGRWKSQYKPVEAAEVAELEERAGQFVIVEGKVRTVGDRPGRLYLNFGRNWSQDFTVVVAKKGSNAFKGNWNQLRNMAGRKIRARGIVEMRGGPLIRMVYEGQLDIAD